MFAIPEVLFLTTPLSILSFVNNFSETNIKAPIYFLINSQFFTDHPIYPLSAVAIEWIGILGLLIISIKCKKKMESLFDPKEKFILYCEDCYKSEVV